MSSRAMVMGLVLCAAPWSVGCGARTTARPELERDAARAPHEDDAGVDAAASVPCASGTWDDDADPSTACVAWTVCEPGAFLVSGGSATSDATCAPCASGTFSTALDAPACTPWTTCAAGEAEAAAGSATSDRLCLASSPWLRQFGSTVNDTALAVSADARGHVFVAGFTPGPLPGQTRVGFYDAFVRAYRADGTELWTRQFGTSELDLAVAVRADASGHVFVAGSTMGVLPGQSSAGSPDAFVRAYDLDGTELWTRQFGTSASDHAIALGVDASGRVYVGGYTDGALPGQSSAGARDAFVRAYTTDGAELWTEQFGSEGYDSVRAVAVDARGVYVAGYAERALPGQAGEGNADAFVRAYASDGTSAVRWTRQFGSGAADYAMAVSVDLGGDVVVAGYVITEGNDSFVRAFGSDGTARWSQAIASTIVYGVTTDTSGRITLVGQADGALPGQTSAGGFDFFLRTCAADGTELATAQLGTSEDDFAYAVGADRAGGVYVVGTTRGALPDQTNAGGSDAFIAHLVP